MQYNLILVFNLITHGYSQSLIYVVVLELQILKSEYFEEFNKSDNKKANKAPQTGFWPKLGWYGLLEYF